jgi:hypothetical protein
MIKSLDRIGSVGALLAAVAAPCCLPIFAALAGALGITALGLNEGLVFYALQVLASLSVIGLAFAALHHRSIGPLLLASISTAALFFVFHARFSAVVVYVGRAGLCVATGWNYFLSRKCERITLNSVITCPNCGHRTEEVMPTNACLFFYDCPACGVKSKPKAGKCCVFCSYGSVPCPPIQSGAVCCM